ncbi:hypothetical protein GE061_002707 [Apolygus lucorum]|uniref:Gustatory receptor n=1 Tax=Apolygus lucorum TaxID=248454 RepID=A0A8S9X8H9_APOLU|nr:hypothetical protein GE061_002707 [Apolygus lucorum]
MPEFRVSPPPAFENGTEQGKAKNDKKWFLFSYSVKKDAYLKQMWPLLIIYRLICRFPFRRTPEGTLEMKMFSIQTAYFIIGFTAQTYLVLENSHGILQLMFHEETDFAEVVTGGLCFCLLAIHLFVPFSIVKEWKYMCEVFNRWIIFQGNYKEVIRTVYKTKLNLVVRIVSCLIPIATFGVTVLHSYVLYHKEWYHLFSYIFVLTSVCVLYGIWIFSLIEIINVADTIRTRSFEIIESKDNIEKSHELYSLRILWHELSIIVRFSSTAVACSMIFVSATGVVIFIASAYGFMKCVAIGDERYFLFFSIMLGMGLVLCVPCEIGYRATLHAGTYIVEMLSSVNMLEQDELTAREVDLFLQAVYSNYPDISYGGMVTVNRETITSIFSATVTYLIASKLRFSGRVGILEAGPVPLGGLQYPGGPQYIPGGLQYPTGNVPEEATSITVIAYDPPKLMSDSSNLENKNTAKELNSNDEERGWKIRHVPQPNQSDRSRREVHPIRNHPSICTTHGS